MDRKRNVQTSNGREDRASEYRLSEDVIGSPEIEILHAEIHFTFGFLEQVDGPNEMATSAAV